MENLQNFLPDEVKEKSKQIIKRVSEYQGEDNIASLYSLYGALIKEEILELGEAIANLDTVEIYDAYVDIYWVATIRNYLSIKYFGIYDKYATFAINFVLSLCDREVLSSCLDEIIKSNFSKSKAKDRNGKIKKGDSYVAPNIQAALYKHKDVIKITTL